MSTLTQPGAKLFAPLAVLCLAITTSAAFGQDQVAVATVTVRYGDLNLESEVGAQALIGRLTRAANTVCGGRPQINLVARVEIERRFESCVARAMQGALANVNHALVSQLYDAKKTLDSRIAKR